MRASVTLAVGFAMSLGLFGCANTCMTGACRTSSTQRLATDEALATTQIEGNGFTHDVYWRGSESAQALWIFIEGDGEPWLKDGSGIADDPTASTPLALRLAIKTPGTVAYLGRPCYLASRKDERCTPAIWTVDRYSSEVVSSMNAAAHRLVERFHAQQIVLVGHSGGGTLAVLMAQDLKPAAVITIGANLDVVEWSARHRYWPLSGSRNPADEPPLPTSTLQFYLVGDLDTNVTGDMSARYLNRVPAESIWHYKNFDHSCCWQWEWSSILDRLGAQQPGLRLR